ncbi:SPRY domain-containing protein 7b [Triplophysa dalaica]|uniref:SPRY domain-containing protein 7b n=1 Tax=Triplophysa dalaica TaxID=1582913 RepID=UPI0024DFB48E|nr:SPRY domain-containing protein 7b [Triplophysa dalaica]
MQPNLRSQLISASLRQITLCVIRNLFQHSNICPSKIFLWDGELCALQFDVCNCTSGYLSARMAAVFTCCLGCCGDGGPGHAPLKEMPTVHLDTHHMGTDVVIVKSGRRICGTGACLANAPLHQNKSYFEFKIQSTGIWGIGVATQKVNLNQVPLGRDSHSLVLRHDGSIYHNNEEKNRLPANSLPQEGDIVGLTYDHVELNMYLNGKNMHCPASGIRGTVFPVVYVDDSAIIDCQFSDFYHTPPEGFEKILFEQQIF